LAASLAGHHQPNTFNKIIWEAKPASYGTSSTLRQPWQIFWSAGKPSQLYSQHLGSQCRYLDSVVWELGSQANNLQHLGSYGRFFGQLGSLASCIVSILAANAAILIQLSGKPSQQCLTILAVMADFLVSWEAWPAIVSILAANSDILIQLSGKPSQLYV
jgi:hypothetical protein